jgi:hypothetical protein
MITDQQVRNLFRLDRHGLPKEVAALKAGTDPTGAATCLLVFVVGFNRIALRNGRMATFLI